VLQQTPSTQLVLVHSVPLWQALPLPLSGAQIALEVQYWPLAQGRLALQPPEHFVVSAHWLLVQAVAVGVVQAPAPLQTEAGVAEPPAQVAAAQITELPAGVQLVALVPPQVPTQGAMPAQAARPLRGAPVTVAQVPTLLASAHPWHCPAQATLQHTPSTHWALLHSAALWQGVPLPLTARHTPVVSQYFPPPQG